jgi:hypothetical protein
LRFDAAFELRKLAQARRGESKRGETAAKMVTPDYLDPKRQPKRNAGQSLLAAKRRKAP